MSLRTALAALAAGLTAFVLVGVAVTELAASRIACSLFLGIPAGLGAGAIAMTVVRRTLGDPRPERRRLGVAIGSFSGGFLVGLAGLAVVGRTGAVTALVGGLAVGGLATLVGWVAVESR